MPRDAAGNYTLPVGNPVVSNTPISSGGWANPTLSDLASEMTKSLSRHGYGGMLAPFKFLDGVRGAPGMTWTNESTSGFYRVGEGEMAVSVRNVPVMRWKDTGVEVRNLAVGDLDEGAWIPLTTGTGLSFLPLTGGDVTGNLGITGHLQVNGTLGVTDDVTINGNLFFDENWIIGGGLTAPINADAEIIDTYGGMRFVQVAAGATNVPAHGNNANGLLTLNSHTGGFCRQVFLPDTDEVYIRRQSSGAFLPWKKFWTEANLTPDYLVQGENKTRSTRIPGGAFDPTNSAHWRSGFWDTETASWTPSAEWHWGITMAHSGNDGIGAMYGAQIVANINGGRIYHRVLTMSGTPSPWLEFYHSGNIQSGTSATPSHASPKEGDIYLQHVA